MLDLVVLVPHLVAFLSLALDGSVEIFAFAVRFPDVNYAEFAKIFVGLPLLEPKIRVEKALAVEVHFGGTIADGVCLPSLNDLRV